MVQIQTLATGSIRLDVSRCTLYNSVNFRPSSRCDVLLELLLGLPAEIAPVHQEEHSAGTAMLDETVNRGNCGEGFSTSRRPLDERSRPALRQRLLEISHRGDERAKVRRSEAEGADDMKRSIQTPDRPSF